MNENSNARWTIAVSAAVIWVFAVYVAYYWAHKPFSGANLVIVPDIVVWLGLLLVATALGRLSRRWLDYSTLLEEIVFSAAMGLGALSLLTLGLGLVGLFYRWLFWLLFLVLAVVLYPQVRAIASRLREGPILPTGTGLNRILAIYLGFILILSFFQCLTPPIAWDSQVYHLTGPKLYRQAHLLPVDIDLPYLGFPSLLEMLFTAGLLLKGDVVAKLIHYTYGLLTLLALFAFARRYFNRKVAWLSMAILYSIPSLVLVSTWAYVDLGLIFYEFTAFYALMRWLEVRDKPFGSAQGRRWLALTAILCGLALGVKYTGVILPITLALIIASKLRPEGRRETGRALLLFGLLAIVVASPWYLKNFFSTGNPVYPFLFGGTYWDEFRAWWYSRAGTGLAFTAPWRLLIAPWEMTVLGIQGTENYDATIGPILLTVVPLLALVWRKIASEERRVIGYAFLVCLVQYLFWLYGVAQSALLIQTRLLFPIFALLALLAGYTVDKLAILTKRAFSLQWFVTTVLLLALGLNAVSSALHFISDSPLPYLAGFESKESYLTRHLGLYYTTVAHISENLPPSARILFLWEPRSYYCQRDCRPDALLDRFLHLTYLYPDADAIARAWAEAGVTHVLLYRLGMEVIVQAGFDPVTPRDLAIMQDLQARHLLPVGEWGNAYVLYEVIP
ncbi:MAG TPA: phospholipid carrier-dependent glycosyltransferase [Anaerolineae bacterium]|nr:phospholipid carrier-dependent glycosyltransferase [Anaerolineae bacterium]